ncbi:uncharacterized protein [Spinacia oleracea]|uniref:Uncharacterized protein isoform X2 n=1 Tax=Spinacia oleracea TaxID=3562 RepID=A0ABM3RA97_SPIOL|nr:uncharacterized protein LOC110775631 isoform X2 [Spinacia oleracea]
MVCMEDLVSTTRYVSWSLHNKFIGEETTAAFGATELTDYPTWIVDPLDGTTNFVHGFPFVCVSIGLTIGKVPTVGVVYNPIMNEVYTPRNAPYASEELMWFVSNWLSVLPASIYYWPQRVWSSCLILKCMHTLKLERTNI